jgi:hypothetical protein
MKFNSLEKTNYSSSYNSLASLETSKSTEPDCETDKKYKRIGEETRNKLLEKIFFDGKKIKKVCIFMIFRQPKN